jgi:hypothetical protein
MAHLQLWTTTHRRFVGLLAAVMVITALSVVSAPAAQAQGYTCNEYGANTIELNDGSASATIYVSKNCSDGLSRFDGVVRDIECDGRAAYLQLDFSNPDAAINSQGGSWVYRSETVSASNGCGTEATFAFSSTNPQPGMYAVVYADGWTSFESDGHSAWF